MMAGRGGGGREVIGSRPCFPLPLWERVDQSCEARLRRVRGLSPRIETPHPARCARHLLPQGEKERKLRLYLRLRPILVAQVTLNQLAGRRARQLGLEIDRARTFDRRQVFPAEQDELFL